MASFPSSFFGLTVTPGKVHTMQLEQATHITMASLPSVLPKNAARSSLILTVDGASFTLCSLTPGKLENQRIDIHMGEGDEVSFSVSGPCAIDISGNNEVIFFPGDSDDEEIDSDMERDMDMEEMNQFEGAASESGSASGSGESDDEAAIEFDDALMAELTKRKANSLPIPANSKKSKLTEVNDDGESISEGESDEEIPASAPAPAKKDTPKAKKETAKVKESPKTEAVKESPKVAKESPKTPKEAVKAQESPVEKKIRTLPSGLVIEDVTLGTGPVAKAGRQLGVRYIGKLANGKTFDSNTKGPPFVFKLGKGAVIKGI